MNKTFLYCSLVTITKLPAKRIYYILKIFLIEIEIYEEKTSKEVYGVLRKFLVKYKWIYFLNNRIFSKIRMKDVRDFIAVIKKVDK